MVTPSGIVAGADGKTVGTEVSTALKVVFLNQKFIVADINIESAKGFHSGITVYDFPVWIRKVGKKMRPEMTVSDLALVIQNNIPSTFKFLIDEIESRRFTRKNAIDLGLNPDGDIVQYVVAGYEKSGPVVYEVALAPDWDVNSVKKPSDSLLYPKNGENANPYLHLLYFGESSAITRTHTANSDEQRELQKRVPVETEIIHKHGTLTLKQVSNVIRSILAIQIEAKPNYVGFPITVVTLPKTGRGWSRTYEQDSFPLSRLPNGQTASEKQK